MRKWGKPVNANKISRNPDNLSLTLFELCLIKLFLSGGSNSVVECNLAKVEVAGSNPVSRSISINQCTQFI